MSFPSISVNTTCSSCKKQTDSCTCNHAAQSTIAMQSLPGPTTPNNAETEPARYVNSDEVVWAGADIPALGVVTGDKMTKVINAIVAALP